MDRVLKKAVNVFGELVAELWREREPGRDTAVKP